MEHLDLIDVKSAPLGRLDMAINHCEIKIGGAAAELYAPNFLSTERVSFLLVSPPCVHFSKTKE